MVLKDDPYSNEASSAAGPTPKTGHNQSHGGYTGATVTTQHPSTCPFVSSFIKLKAREICLWLHCRFWMLNIQIHSMCFGGPSAGPQSSRTARNQLGLFEKAACSVQGPPSSWLFCLDHPACCVTLHDRTMLLSPWTHRIVFLGPWWKQIAAKGPRRSQ